ncbi:MAG: hypothetical protein IPL20_06375 [Saprospiraceae bacterium]|nr:hypothetical protein [Saprospiraceae bacterium]
MEAEEAMQPKKEFADETLDAGGSLLDNKDDFFNKASQYADGHYDAFSEGKVVVNTNPDQSEVDKKMMAIKTLTDLWMMPL